jgi:glycerophosphoryl diester phosphodiesterase
MHPLATDGHEILDAGRPIVFAHRGGSALRPENTMAAFEHGLAVGADALELDVQLARDGVVVACHDVALDRTTNARGLLSARTGAELAAVDAAWSFGASAGFPLRNRGIGVPRLAEVLDAFPAAPLIIELKGTDPALAEAAVNEVRMAGAMSRVCFGSFSEALLERTRRCGNDVITSAGTSEIRWALYRSWVGVSPVDPRYQAFIVPERYGARRIATRQFVRVMRGSGLPVCVWSVDHPADMRRLLAWGVAGIITDRPDLAREAVDEFLQKGSGRISVPATDNPRTRGKE